MRMISNPILSQTSTTQLIQTITMINSRDLIESMGRCHTVASIKKKVYSQEICDCMKILEI